MKSTVNNQFGFEIHFNNANLSEGEINGKPFRWDVVNDPFHIIYSNKSYRAQVVAMNKKEKTISLRINSIDYHVALKDRYDEILHKFGWDESPVNRMSELRSPMPGLVLSVMVSAGDIVKMGDKMLVLEAMKMENVIKSPGEGKVKELRVKQGMTVDKNELLIKFE